MHLADACIQSDSHSIQALCFFNACIPGNRTHNIGIASALLQQDINGAGQIIHWSLNIFEAPNPDYE